LLRTKATGLFVVKQFWIRKLIGEITKMRTALIQGLEKSGNLHSFPVFYHYYMKIAGANFIKGIIL
jgi:hypothetical protein